MPRVAKKSTNEPVLLAKRATRKKTATRPKTKRRTSTAEDRNSKDIAGAKRQVQRDLRHKIRAMQAELKSAEGQYKQAIKRERANSQAIKDELNHALKRERALIKLFDARDEALRGFGNRWTKKKIIEIQKAPKKRRRRKVATPKSAAH